MRVSHAIHSQTLVRPVLRRTGRTAVADQHAPQESLQQRDQLAQESRVVATRLHLLEAAEDLRRVRRRIHVVLVETHIQQTRQRVQRIALSASAVADEKAWQLVLDSEEQTLQERKRLAEKRLVPRGLRAVDAATDRVSNLDGRVGDVERGEQRRDVLEPKHAVEEGERALPLRGVAHSLEEEHRQEDLRMPVVHVLIREHQVAPAEDVAQVELEGVHVLGSTSVLHRV